VTGRQPLPARRPVERFEFNYNSQRFTACIGRFPDGRLAEIFLTCDRRSGSELDGMARDAAILLSLALQYGCPLQTAIEALGRRDIVIDKRLIATEWASPIGAALANLPAAES
jgi:ribonucleoside-diphosphate reductase alpha chain